MGNFTVSVELGSIVVVFHQYFSPRERLPAECYFGQFGERTSAKPVSQTSGVEWVADFKAHRDMWSASSCGGGMLCGLTFSHMTTRGWAASRDSHQFVAVSRSTKFVRVLDPQTVFRYINPSQLHFQEATFQ
jgi:hypothetical protein